MDDAKGEQTKEIVHSSNEKIEAQMAPTVDPVHNDSNVPKIVPPAKTAKPRKKRRRTKLPDPQASAVVESQGSREIVAAFSESSQKPPPLRKRKRTPQGQSTTEDQTHEWRQDVWAWKAVGQLSSYVDWIREHQTNEELLITSSTTQLYNQEMRSFLIDSLPTSSGIEMQEALDGVLVRQSASLQVMLSATPLQPIGQLVQSSNLQQTGQSDVASFASYGSLRSINFRIAKWLIDTRKSVRPELSQGPWPSEDLVFNSSESRELNTQRFTKLTDLILKSVECSCTLDPDIQWNGKAVICIRVGLDVASDERSLIVCATADSSQSAKLIGGKLWKRVLQTTFPESCS